MAGKGFDAKAFLLNHTEKLILGIAGLMVLAFLGGSQWSSYKGTPEDITAKVAKSSAALKGHDWPEEEKLKYEMTQKRTPKQVVHDNLLSPIAVSQYEMSTRFVSSPWQGKEPLREPSLLTLEDALATSGKVLIERPMSVSVPGDESAPGEKPKDSPRANDPFADFASGRPAGGAGPGQIGLPGAAGHDAPSAGHGGPAIAMPAPTAHGGPATAGHGASGGSSDIYGGMMGGAVAAEREAQGYYFASVRAVFPLKEQIRRYQEAIHAKTFDIASFSFEVIDFQLERQEQSQAPDSWTDWQQVDTQSAVDVLTQSMPPEPDIVSGTVTNNVMTMPLPPLIYGNWRKHGSHQRIDKFELSDEQVQMEIDYQSKLLELMRDNTRKTEVKPRREKGGFSGIMGDSRALQSDVLGGSAYGNMGSGYGGMPYSGAPAGMNMGMPSGPNMGMPMGPRGGRPSPANPGQRGAGFSPDTMKRLLETDDRDEQSKRLREYIEQRVTADGELLLFRYFDFTVEPGKTYRYRVRLVLNNPNFGHLASEANGEALVVEGETRTTDWSNITSPVEIERATQYFVKDVDTRSGRTKVSIYQWNTKLGTTVNADLDLYPGQHIAGSVKTNVIDPAKSSYKEAEPYSFDSADVFVDTLPDVALDRNLHKDLKVPGGSKGDVLLPEEALVVRAHTGDLAILDPLRQQAEQKRLEVYQSGQDKFFEYMKASAATATEMMMGMPGDEMYNPYSTPTKKGGKGKSGRSSNPLAGGAAMGMGMPAGGMPAGGRGGAGRRGP